MRGERSERGGKGEREEGEGERWGEMVGQRV